MKYTLIIFLLMTNIFANTIAGYNNGITKSQVEKDIKNQNMQKYKDNFETLNIKTLAKKNIIKTQYITDSNSTKFYITDNTEFYSVDNFAQKINCSKMINLQKWTATLYSVDPKNGIVKCLIAPQNNLQNPIGIYKISYPKAKEYFTKNIANAKNVESTQIADAKTKFNTIYQTIKTKSDALKTQQENGSLNLDVPGMFLNTVITNTDIIDVTATRDLGKLTFKQNVNPSPVAKKIAINDAESFFNIYTGLSDISMKYLMILLLFFGGYGLFHQFSPAITDKIENTKTVGKHTHYAFGLVAGLLLFVPTTEYTAVPQSVVNTDSGRVLAGYNIMQTNFQKMERKGYTIFSNWANDATKIIIDAQMQDIINKTGIGTADQITNAYAGKIQYKNLLSFSSANNLSCTAGYNKAEMYMTNKKTKYKFSDNSSTVFPTSEKYGYAMALHNGADKYYYKTLPNQTFYNTNVVDYYNNAVASNTQNYDIIGKYFYPKKSLAFCGKTYYQNNYYKDRYDDYTSRLKNLTGQTENESQKLQAINYIVNLQYQLYNNWGFLSILGLPITKLQTEMIGGLYKDGNSNYITQLNKQIEKNSTINHGLHSFFSALPYLLFPGAGEIQKATAGASKSVLNSITGLFGGVVKKVASVATGAVSQAAGFAMAIAVVKSVLVLLPIVGIILLGTLRFIIILIKVFTIHFSALFLLPVSFAKQNITAITSFTIKLFVTMLEIPLFVLGVWISIVSYGLISTIGGTLSKSLIVGAIGNQEANSNATSVSLWHPLDYLAHSADNFLAIIKLYIFDGIMELAIAIFSIVLIYKIIITFHSMVLQAVELRGITLLDDTVDTIRTETTRELI